MVEDKSLKAYKAGQRSKEKRGKHKRRKDEIHLIPDVFYASAVAIPFVTTTPESQTSAVDSLLMPGASISERLANFANAATQGTVQNIVPIAELGIVGYIARVLGKKVGLNKVGTKEVKLA
jgi:hypothetical protein